ncbi:MAG: glycosyltransferase family 2 protein [candidate division NC10 bacterium]|nr:glycosyltransferase family 2 protein [candidate division NC10 bacterium]
MRDEGDLFRRFLSGLTDRILDILPIVTTILILAIYPLLRFVFYKPLLAEIFRASVISYWIGYLIVNMLLALKTRREIITNSSIDWHRRLLERGHSFSHYVIFMPLKNESNCHVLFQTFLGVQHQAYPQEKVELVPIIEAEDLSTIDRVREIIPSFQEKLRIKLFTYPTAGVHTKCKATSVSTAGRWLAQRIAAGEFGSDQVKVLIIDADTTLHPQDLALREYCHLMEIDRCQKTGERGSILQSLTTYTSNYWKVAMLPRLHNSGFVLYQMGKMQTRGDYLVLGPGTSIPFKIFQEVDYFEPNRHNEDMQFRYKVVMEGYRVAPLKMPTWGQAPWTTRESWGQIARWARGAVDFKFVVNYRRKHRQSRLPLTKTKTYQALRALVANSIPPLMVLLPTQLILISWFSPYYPLFTSGFFVSPDVLALRAALRSGVDALAAFNLRYQAVVLTSSMLIGMILVPHLLKPVIHQSQPRRWRRARRSLEWLRLTFTPINLHNYFLMAFAQLYTQTKLALGISITHTEITRK